MLFPRSVWLAIPGVALLASLVMRRWKPALISAVGVVLVLGPIMDFRLPWTRVFGEEPIGQVVRIMTLNFGSYPINVERLRQLVAQERIDVLCFQELADNNPAFVAYLREGWYVSSNNKLASRFPILEEYPGMVQDSLDSGRYVGELTRVRVRLPNGRESSLASVHLPTLKPGLIPLKNFEVQRINLLWPWWDRQMSRTIDMLMERPALSFLAGGDFNMPAEHPRFQAYGPALHLAFNEVGFGYGYTRGTRMPWVRIDHVLGSAEWRFTRCWLGPFLGSDHLPVIAEAVFSSSSSKAH